MTSSNARPSVGGGATPVFFLAGGTGISAETLGNLILNQFPSVEFTRRKIPFITTPEQAHEAVAEIDGGSSPPAG